MTLSEQPAELIDRPPAAGPPKVTISRSAPMPPDISGPDVEVPVPSARGAGHACSISRLGEDFGAYLIALPLAGAILGLWIGLAGFVSAQVRVRFLDGPLAPGSFDGWKRSIRVGDAPQADLYVPVTPGRPVDVTVTPAGDVVRVEGVGIMAVNGQPNEAKLVELREGDLVSLGDHHCTITWKA